MVRPPAALLAAALLAACAGDKTVTVTDLDYQPAAIAAAPGPLLPASVSLMSTARWEDINLHTAPDRALSVGPALRSTLIRELAAIFQKAEVVPYNDPADNSDLDVVSEVSFPSAVNLGGYGAFDIALRTIIVSRETGEDLANYNASVLIDIPKSSEAAKARAMMTAIETLSHAFGRAIATDETLRTNVFLGVYQPDFQNPTAAPPSPYDAALNAVVRITQEGEIASGFFVGADGTILTAAHVVGDTSIVAIKTRQGVSYTAQVEAVDTSRDLALLKIPAAATPFPTLQLSSTISPVIGTGVTGIGAPYGLSWSITKGYIGGVRQLRVARVVQFDKALDPGNSGGPMIDDKTGQVIGIMSFTGGNIGFAVLAEEARKAFKGKIAD